MSSNSGESLRKKARAMLVEGRLPNTTNPTSIEGARVVKTSKCVLCGDLIDAGKIAIAIVAEGKRVERQRYGGMHFNCHAAWAWEVTAEAEAPPQVREKSSP